jgi:hypothetical protein
MENRLIVVLLAFLVIGGFGTYVNHSVHLEEKRKVMLESLENLKNVEESITSQKNQIAATQRELDGVKQRLLKLQVIVAKRLEANATEAAYPNMVTAFQKTVSDVRLATVGMQIKNLKVPNGPLIESASVTKVGDGELTFSHSGGITKIAAKDLPPELKDRLLFDDPLIVKKVAVSAVPSTVTRATVAPTAPSLPTVDQVKVAQLRLTLENLLKQSAAATEAATTSNTKISQIQARHQSNNLMRISDSSATEIKAAQEAAKQAQAQANAIDAQIIRVKGLLEAALQGR